LDLRGSLEIPVVGIVSGIEDLARDFLADLDATQSADAQGIFQNSTQATNGIDVGCGRELHDESRTRFDRHDTVSAMMRSIAAPPMLPADPSVFLVTARAMVSAGQPHWSNKDNKIPASRAATSAALPAL